ncbi:MAG: class F420-dependent oxidoreductase, partial [Acidimicrobiaceae bacterium]|nr:class F420-dependent oxidoreductase [Acidimicrobiaceae bacterium]
MHFGVHLIAFVERDSAENGEPMAAFRSLVRSADRYGFDRITTGEHSSGGRLECISALSCIAMTARKAHVGPLVTNGVTRDIGVAAAAIASLDTLSNGRSFYVLGRGNAGIRSIGLRPSTLEETRQFFLAIRDLLQTGHAQFRGRDVILNWPYSLRRVPLYLVAEGPLMLDLAGRVADGVYLGCGLLPEVIADSVERVRAGATAAGRDPDSV